jgi:tRNA(Ile)-lysidine synthase
VAVAHTRTDQAETVLLRMLRGSGLAGLAAMAPSRTLSPELRLVRPLLGITRSEVRQYAVDRRLPVCEDPTNRDLRMSRNRLRMRVWPALQELSPQLERHLADLAERCREDDRALEELAAAACASALHSAPSGEIVLRTAALRELPPAVARRVLRRACRRARPGAQPTAAQVARVLGMVESGRAAEAHLSGDLSARLWRGDLLLKPRQRVRPPASPFRYVIDGEGLWPCPDAGLSLRVAAWSGGPEGSPPDPNTLLLARDALTFPLEVRNRRPGDRFRPSRGPGSRKLKRFLMDEGVARDRRDRLPLLCSEGEILWVVGLRAGNGARRPAAGAPGWKLEVAYQPSPGPSAS